MKSILLPYPLFSLTRFLAIITGLVFLAELVSDWKADDDALNVLENDTTL